MDLCKPCLEDLKQEGHKFSLVQGGIDHKVTCSRCGKRKYGATYEVAGSPKGGAKR